MPTELLDNRYKIVRPLGEGAMGAVYQVEESATGQVLAMKVLGAQHQGGEKSYLQLKQEFRLMTRLRHPNCCAVYDYGLLESGAPFLTMELVPGHGLDELVPLPLDQVVPVLTQLCLALGYVHQLGYVHADVKSANVRVRPDGQVKLMDYGLMELAGHAGGPIRGTVGYLAPEVIKRGRVDRRADLYALGALAYEMITGQLPFRHEALLDLLRQHLNDPPEPPSGLRKGLDPTLEQVVLTLLAKEPVERFQSAYEVLEALGVEVPAGLGGTLLSAPMVERAGALATLTEPLERLSRLEAGGTILVLGEDGVGKSRLLDELRFETQAADLHHIHVSQRGSPVPYGPFVELLRRALPLAQVRLPKLVERLAPVLVKLVPSLTTAQGRAVAPAPELDPPNREKVRLQDAVTVLLGELARPGGLVLAFDDWHRADPLSQELMAYLLRNTEGLPLLVVLSTSGAPSPAPGWLERAVQLPLPPLSREGVALMLASMLGTTEVAPHLVAQVHALSQGNPLLIEHMLEHLISERVLVSEGRRWRLEVELTREHLPTDSAAYRLRQLEGMPALTRELAAVAAVVGELASLELLQAVSGLPEDDLLDAVHGLEVAQFLRGTEDGLLAFCSPEVQRHLVDSLEPARRQALHERCLEALEARVGGAELADQPIELVTALARHSLSAQDRDRAIPYALEAGTRRLALLALDEAEEFLTQGLALARGVDATHGGATLIRFLEALGSIRRPRGDGKGAKEVQAEAIDLAERLGRRRELGRLLGSQAKAAMLMGENPVALEYAQRAVAVSDAEGDDVNVGRCLLTAARALFFSGKLQEALAQANRAAMVAERIGDVVLQGSAFALAGYFHVASSDPGQIPLGIERLERSLAVLQPSGEKLALVNSYNLLGNAQNALGDHRGAWASFLAGRTISYEVGLRADEVVAIINLAITSLDLGNLPEATVRAEEAVALATTANVRYAQGYASALHAVACAWSGHGERALEQMASALAYTRDIKNKYVEALILLYQVELLLLLGQHEAAMVAARCLRDLIDQTGNAEPEPKLNALLGELHLRRNEGEEAAWRAELAYQAAVTSQSRGGQVRALRVKAAAAAHAGRWQDAYALAEQGLALADQIGTLLEASRLAAAWGEATIALGLGGALARYEAARDRAREAGAPALEAVACYGMACARPHAPEAPGLVQQARELLRAVREALPEDVQTAYSALEEHARILYHNHHFHSTPRRLPPPRNLMLEGFLHRRGCLDVPAGHRVAPEAGAV
ncbi:MAG: protein kinase [Candidatus Sericytochromatia bacterium]|nr:protein kinase [Candidatus Sericytochromatia bacterium]